MALILFPAIHTRENIYFRNRLHGEDHGTKYSPKCKRLSCQVCWCRRRRRRGIPRDRSFENCTSPRHNYKPGLSFPSDDSRSAMLILRLTLCFILMVSAGLHISTFQFDSVAGSNLKLHLFTSASNRLVVFLSFCCWLACVMTSKVEQRNLLVGCSKRNFLSSSGGLTRETTWSRTRHRRSLLS